MSNKLLEIRQKGESEIEKLLQSYRDDTYKDLVEDYITKWHSDCVNSDWVVKLKDETKNKINKENNMNNVYNIAIEFQVEVEKKANNSSEARDYYTKILGDYIPYSGWDYAYAWYSGMNSIKDKYIAKMGQMTDEDEIKSTELSAEAEIENYVNPIIKQEAKRVAEAEAAARAASRSSSSSGSSKSSRSSSSSGSSKSSSSSGSSKSSSSSGSSQPLYKKFHQTSFSKKQYSNKSKSTLSAWSKSLTQKGNWWKK